MPKPSRVCPPACDISLGNAQDCTHKFAADGMFKLIVHIRYLLGVSASLTEHYEAIGADTLQQLKEGAFKTRGDVMEYTVSKILAAEQTDSTMSA